MLYDSRRYSEIGASIGPGIQNAGRPVSPSALRLRIRIRIAPRDAEIADDRDGVNLEAGQLLAEQALQRIDGASDRANGENLLNSTGHRPPPRR
jgi:hypothetical protein